MLKPDLHTSQQNTNTRKAKGEEGTCSQQHGALGVAGGEAASWFCRQGRLDVCSLLETVSGKEAVFEEMTGNGFSEVK